MSISYRLAARPSRFVSEEQPSHSERPASRDHTATSSFSNPSRLKAPPYLKSTAKKLPQNGSSPPSAVQSPGSIKVAKRGDGFIHQPSSQTQYSEFQSPPLTPGLLSDLLASVGRNAKPFPIQSLSMAHFLGLLYHPSKSFPPESSQTLLASETGSGKSVAYLIPLIQGLKATERPASGVDQSHGSSLRPRALVLAPTHELCRQLTSYTKALSHEVKLRTICLSNPPPRAATSSRQLSKVADTFTHDGPTQLIRQADIVIGTPSKVAQMAGLDIETDEESPSAAARVKPVTLRTPEMDLEGVEWIIIDEADVMFGECSGFFFVLFV